MGIFGNESKKSLIEQSTDVISSFTTIVTKLTALNEKLQISKDAKKIEIKKLQEDTDNQDAQQVFNENIIDNVNAIVGVPVDKQGKKDS